MNTCDEIREHLESCEDCRLHVSVEARLRTQPVLEPPRGLVARVMKSLPRAVPLRREVFRLAAAAVLMIALAGGALFFHLDETAAASEVKPRLAHAWQAVTGMVNDLNLLNRSE
jgi:acyl dehydratase